MLASTVVDSAHVKPYPSRTRLKTMAGDRVPLRDLTASETVYMYALLGRLTNCTQYVRHCSITRTSLTVH